MPGSGGTRRHPSLQARGIGRFMQLSPKQNLSKNQMAAALECAGESIVITDKEGLVQYVNPSFTRLTGYTLAEALGSKPSLWRSQRHTDEFYADLWNCITAGRVWQGEVTNQKRDHSTYDAQLIIAPIFGEQHEIQGYVSTLSEISAYKKLQSDLRQACDEARRESAARWRNLAYISHDIRTPLNGLLGLLEILEEKIETMDHRELLATMKRAGQNILALVDNILDDSRIDADKLQLDAVDFDLRDSLRDVQQLLRAKAAAAHSVIRVQVPERVPTVSGDANRVSRILQNLVGNATKFTENGEIRLSLEIASETEENVVLHLIVEDNGIGIEEEAQKHIFDQFSQANSNIYQRYGGSGLGLTITRKIVELMHGEISLWSRPGHGTRFTVNLPFKKARMMNENVKAKAASGQTLAFPGVKALVCDDDELNQKILARLLAKYGVEAETAGNGAEGLDMLIRQPFDIAFIDLQMPILDGEQMAQLVREHSDQRVSKTALVAVTGAAHYFQERALTETCFNDYIVKPITPQLVLQALQRAFPKP
jgi:PAS domain S-box-containing protein